GGGRGFCVPSDSLARLFLYDHCAQRIREINPVTGAVLNSFPSPLRAGTGSDTGLATTPTSLLVGGTGNTAINELDPDTGATLRTIPMPAGYGNVSGMAYLQGEIFVRGAYDSLFASSFGFTLDYAPGAFRRQFRFFGNQPLLAATRDRLVGVFFDPPFATSTLYFTDPLTGGYTQRSFGLAASGLGVIGEELYFSTAGG